jgi:hypothetical protein
MVAKHRSVHSLEGAAMTNEQVFSAQEGLTYAFLGREEVVGPKCDDKTAPGNWVCADHGESFPHNWAMQSHNEQKGRHTVVWNCHKHGPEVP